MNSKRFFNDILGSMACQRYLVKFTERIACQAVPGKLTLMESAALKQNHLARGGCLPAADKTTPPLPCGGVVPVSSVVGPYLLAANPAVTAGAAFRVMTQLVFPLHAPVQPEKTEPADGFAVNVTRLPGA